MTFGMRTKMLKNIIKMNVVNPELKKFKKVSAYTRVSDGKEAMLHSLSAQISYYSDYIQKRLDLEYSGVYADKALTGTKDNRPEFQRMIKNCEDGKIDIIITKSISRFARNTVTTLEVLRKLKSIGVDVYFEEKNIHSLSADGELMITLLASYAQEESRSVSENCKWRIRNKFKEGLPNQFKIFGYNFENNTLKINKYEAKIVEMIFKDYLSGMDKNAIMKKLIKLNVPTKLDKRFDLNESKNACENTKMYTYLGRSMSEGAPRWQESMIYTILLNEKYTDDLLLQKSYISDHITKKMQ